MKVFSFCFIGLLSFSSWALDFSKATEEQIKEQILSEVYPVYTGDDGMECQANIDQLEILERSASHVAVRFRAQRDVAVHGCAPAIIRCTAVLAHVKGAAPHTSFYCR